jgi:hypothetical protein
MEAFAAADTWVRLVVSVLPHDTPRHSAPIEATAVDTTEAAATALPFIAVDTTDVDITAAVSTAGVITLADITDEVGTAATGPTISVIPMDGHSVSDSVMGHPTGGLTAVTGTIRLTIPTITTGISPILTILTRTRYRRQ